MATTEKTKNKLNEITKDRISALLLFLSQNYAMILFL